jgi:hypothetical protein
MEDSKESLKNRVEELLKKYNAKSFKYSFLKNVLKKLNDENHTLRIAKEVNPDKIYKYCKDVFEKYFGGFNKCLGIHSNASLFPGKTISINIYIVSYILGITDGVIEIIEKMNKMKNEEFEKKHRKLSIFRCRIRKYSWSSADALLSLGDNKIDEILTQKNCSINRVDNWFYEKEDKSSPYVSFSELLKNPGQNNNSDFIGNNQLIGNYSSINGGGNPPKLPPKTITINKSGRTCKLHKL